MYCDAQLGKEAYTVSSRCFHGLLQFKIKSVHTMCNSSEHLKQHQLGKTESAINLGLLKYVPCSPFEARVDGVAVHGLY